MSTSMVAPAARGDRFSNKAEWSAALRLLREALSVLDKSEAPPEIGAQVATGMDSLERAIHRSVQRSS